MKRRVTGALVGVLLTVGASTGCGAPSDGTRTINASAVPYRLLSTPPPAPPADAVPNPDDVTGQVYFVDADDFLVAVPYSLDGTRTTDEMARDLLDQLSRGPADDARDTGLGTALRPDVTLELLAITGTTAEVDVSTPNREPAPDQLPLAVGQIVLTVTSLPGVTQVTLLTDAQPVDMPLPGGQLTSPPVPAAAYQDLLRTAPTPTST